ncbi:hypothetical protein Godav_018418 [Gossypium davidsonii]|uniref:RNase H type-1 domain-containing protein n=2 Tax=Gossypium TaxID=3633 RepID=A0A7J8QXN7_GOSDV|nr:hypothetical protein [Gossypium davidsonii]MBA0640837.1 hypothetical protein [Gossypium klotzschianum]
MVLVAPYACQPKWVMMDDKAWHPPKVDWIKMNMDGSISLNDEEAIVGGGVHNSHGDWFIDFTKNIVMIETDNALLVQFLCNAYDYLMEWPRFVMCSCCVEDPDCLFKDHSNVVVLDSILTHGVV